MAGEGFMCGKSSVQTASSAHPFSSWPATAGHEEREIIVAIALFQRRCYPPYMTREAMPIFGPPIASLDPYQCPDWRASVVGRAHSGSSRRFGRLGDAADP